MKESDLYFDYRPGNEAQLASTYAEHGVVAVRGLISPPVLNSWKESLVRLMRARLRNLGESVHTAEELDSCFSRLVAMDPKLGMEVILLGRDMPWYYEAISLPEIRAVLRALIKDTVFQIVHDICLFRIDPPNFDDRNFGWHQDYPYNMMSQNAVTAWIPLTQISAEMGRLHVIPGSHKKIWPVELRTEQGGSGKGTGHRAFRLDGADSSALDTQSMQISDLNPGDALFFHSCLLHRSGLNRSNRSRWVCNLRYGDMLDPDLVQRGWRVVRDKHPFVFSEVHPELTRG